MFDVHYLSVVILLMCVMLINIKQLMELLNIVEYILIFISSP